MSLLLAACVVAALAQEPEVIRTDISIVPVTVSVTDKSGRPVDNIQAGELKLLDNGRAREVSFSQDVNAPIIVGLIADISGTQFDFYQQHADALKQFVGQVLRPGDRGFLISVGYYGESDVRMVRDLTGSVETLRAGVESLRKLGTPLPQFGDRCATVKCRGTALWNSVYSASDRRMRLFSGRKALVVLSDGVDSGSQHPLEQAIEAAQSTDAPVYTIHTAKPGAFFGASAKQNNQGRRDLQKLSDGTGGRAYGESEDYAHIFGEIDSELRNLYVLTFSVAPADRDGKFHRLEVKTTRKDLRVRARAGYIAR